MDRSLAGRLGIGSLTSQPARTRQGASAAARPKRSRAPARRRANAFDLAIGRLAALLTAAGRLAGSSRSFVWRRRRLRIVLLVALVVSPLLAGGWLWLRGSSLVAVRQVRVTGARGSEGQAIDAALSAAARRMTTLDVHARTLRAAVASYPVVSDLKISTSFPHGMSIRVIEQPAVAALSVAGAKTAVAANGVALGPGLASGSLPTVSGATLPAPGRRLHDGALLGALTVLGAAPSPLAKQVTRAYSTSKGLTLAMHSGLIVYFGDASRPHAKWLSLARVLADPSSAGASYVDVRLPERPAAGFLGGVAPASSGSEAESSGSGSAGGESPEALAEGLTAAVGGGAAASTPNGTQSASGETEEEASPASAPAGEQASSEASSETGG
jgi:cell division protein FtsQ